ncbi:hypothetical protein [Lachnobacterium bovis]
MIAIFALSKVVVTETKKAFAKMVRSK